MGGGAGGENREETKGTKYPAHDSGRGTCCFWLPLCHHLGTTGERAQNASSGFPLGHKLQDHLGHTPARPQQASCVQ